MESFSLKTEAWAGSPGAELGPGPAPPPGLPQPRPAVRARPPSDGARSLLITGLWGALGQQDPSVLSRATSKLSAPPADQGRGGHMSNRGARPPRFMGSTPRYSRGPCFSVPGPAKASAILSRALEGPQDQPPSRGETYLLPSTTYRRLSGSAEDT